MTKEELVESILVALRREGLDVVPLSSDSTLLHVEDGDGDEFTVVVADA